MLAEKHTLLTEEVNIDKIKPIGSDSSDSGVDDQDDGKGKGEGKGKGKDEDEAIGNDPRYDGLLVNAEDDVDLIMQVITAAGFALL